MPARFTFQARTLITPRLNSFFRPPASLKLSTLKFFFSTLNFFRAHAHSMPSYKARFMYIDNCGTIRMGKNFELIGLNNNSSSAETISVLLYRYQRRDERRQESKTNLEYSFQKVLMRDNTNYLWCSSISTCLT